MDGSQQQQQRTPSTSNQSNRQSRTVSGIVDPGNPVKILEPKGITEENKFDLAKLAEILLSYGDFKRAPNSSTYIKKEEINPIRAIGILMQEIARQHTPDEDDTHITKAILDKALADLKDNLVISLSNNYKPNSVSSNLNSQPNSYANAVRSNTTINEALRKKQATAQRRDLFISIKNVDHAHHLLWRQL
ncbi:hypothetical protein AcW1_005647 [Taiwanofungus camphoratus]|nr:hypothetical protein AcW2_004411 [Antrodia cinnamomea]KAI0933155.1 hypothetical protein AcV7_004710 [Antrodia cinnamomea]KAI0957173.1 hypothetical protein AcW1_005647 [Antrodia cinnamomea]